MVPRNSERVGRRREPSEATPLPNAPRTSGEEARRREPSEATPLPNAPRTLGEEARIRAPNAAALSRKLGLFSSSSSPSFVAA